MKLLTIVLDPSVGNTRKQDSINRLFRGAKKKQIADFRREVAVIGLPLMAGRPDAGNFSEPLKFIFRKIRQAVMNGDLTTAEQSLRVFENLAGQEKIRAAIGAEHELAGIFRFKTLAADIRATGGWLAVLSVLKIPRLLGITAAQTCYRLVPVFRASAGYRPSLPVERGKRAEKSIPFQKCPIPWPLS